MRRRYQPSLTFGIPDVTFVAREARSNPAVFHSWKLNPDTISALSNQANTVGSKGELHKAVAVNREIWQRGSGGLNPDTINAMNNWANTLRDQGKLDEATIMFMTSQRSQGFPPGLVRTVAIVWYIISTNRQRVLCARSIRGSG
jgi:ABC-type transport system involved in Fe-S cluster assembly fused permease/ATPase subunit